ncbi:type III secretion system stator protein SctL [Trinickia fusca]|uniref:Type 3 secretion system stator protein n=1 Tax=Trinickia fusca TaxID=2419777 RepID=A0A494X4G3_9BURK|nr:type III secretion system stator protein SctL [Trinickia fusca]RKP44561.1 HrpE/YscL family type III secretion apparatus protein [Trinickia fusca]
MVIWLRHPNVELSRDAETLGGIGVEEDSGILRREAFATVVALDDAQDVCRREYEAILADARQRAEDITARADEEALALLEQAQEEYESAERRGYDDGKAQALADWYARVAEHGAEQRDMQTLLRERLAELVVVAVEQIVRSEDTSALFARSSAALDRIADGCSYLKVRVHPDDYEAASREFARFATEWRERGRAVPVSVMADRELGVGACICESDLGMVDASLSTQLAAMRAAVERALAREVEQAEPNTEDGHDLDPSAFADDETEAADVVDAADADFVDDDAVDAAYVDVDADLLSDNEEDVQEGELDLALDLQENTP